MIGVLAGVLGALAIVVALLLFAARAAQRLGLGNVRGDADLRVLRRVPLGPRQGIALVQIADRVVAVSVGDGGVRTVLELDPADVARFQPQPVQTLPFRAMLERSLKQSRTALVLLATSLAFTFAAPLSAQDSGQPIQRVSLPAAAAATADPSLMSVPRPAIFVAMVIAPR
jgi:flagellar protein FliO/FliZ